MTTPSPARSSPLVVDVHTHIFPPRMIERRGRLVPRDPAFAEMYGEAGARMAGADALIDSMDAAGVAVSVACGFWWHDPALAEEHAAYILDAAAASRGRIVPFVPLAGVEGDAAAELLARLARHGARGLGEVRPGPAPDTSSLDSALTAAAEAHGLVSLVHVSEPVGHAYPGKHGGYTPEALWRLLEPHSALRVIAAHWGGGLPFYALMPEVERVIEDGRLVFDTAASALLYSPEVFARGIELAGPRHVLWGSDFPLRSQTADRAAVEAALPDDATRAAVLGGNAARFLGLAPPG